MIERLKNCPNCAGWLDDGGRCNYCGSKVYDFCDINLDKQAPKYIRIRHQNKVITARVIIDTFNFELCIDECPHGSIDYRCVGDVTMEEIDDGQIS